MDVVALQEKIGRIDGIEAARVVAVNGNIDEVHVLARKTKPAKQLVRDVQSLSQALFGLDIDRRVVSVVQLADADLDVGNRPALVDVSEHFEGSSGRSHRHTSMAGQSSHRKVIRSCCLHHTTATDRRGHPRSDSSSHPWCIGGRHLIDGRPNSGQ